MVVEDCVVEVEDDEVDEVGDTSENQPGTVLLDQCSEKSSSIIEMS